MYLGTIINPPGMYLEIYRRKEVNVLGSPLSGRRATGIGRGDVPVESWP